MYLDHDSKPGKTEVNRVIQTPECWLSWPISVNGHPPSDDDKEKARKRLEGLINDPDSRNNNRKQIDEDAAKATALVKILPDAFLFTPAGRQDGFIKLTFKPNPDFKPSSHEAKVFHAMAGVLLINAKEKRLAKLSGKLTHDVDFGLGVLAKIHKGGTFSVVQSEVAPGDWELTRLDVYISGRAMFFHSISEQQHEVKTGFREVPAKIELQQASSMVQQAQPQGSPKLAANRSSRHQQSR